jgi:hypothetical protein
MAPEFLKHQRCSAESDVFSFAIIMWEVWYRRSAFEGLNAPQIAYNITEGKRLPLEGSCPAELQNLISRSWQPEPTERPDFSEILSELKLLYKKLKSTNFK